MQLKFKANLSKDYTILKNNIEYARLEYDKAFNPNQVSLTFANQSSPSYFFKKESARITELTYSIYGKNDKELGKIHQKNNINRTGFIYGKNSETKFSTKAGGCLNALSLSFGVFLRLLVARKIGFYQNENQIGLMLSKLQGKELEIDDNIWNNLSEADQASLLLLGQMTF